MFFNGITLYTINPRSLDPLLYKSYYVNGSRLLGHTVSIISLCVRRFDLVSRLLGYTVSIISLCVRRFDFVRKKSNVRLGKNVRYSFDTKEEKQSRYNVSPRSLDPF